jgi:ribosomal-protein-alanine N-acetyltransferase
MTQTFNFSSFPTLVTDRLILREMTPNDISAILKNFGNPDVVKYLDMKPIITREQAEHWFQWMGDFFISKDGIRWGVTLKDDYGVVIGSAGLHHWDRESHYAEIGYDIAEAYWGNGYAKEVVQALLAFGWDSMNLHRIEADVLEGNDASMHILKKFGFQHEGVLRKRVKKNRRFWDVHLFGLLKVDYKPLKNVK